VHEQERRLVADLEDEDPGAAARSVPGWLVLAAAAALIAIVAFASRSAPTPATDLAFDFGPLFTTIRVIGYVGLAIGTLAFPMAFAMARARSRRDRARREALMQRQLTPVPWWARALGILVLVAMFAFQIAVVLAFIDELRRAAAAGGGSGAGGLNILDTTGIGHAGDDVTALTIALAIVAGLGLVIVVVALRWRVLDEPTGLGAFDRRAAVVEAVDLSLDALRGEPDPRRAVIAAYGAMERSLSGAGFGRRRSEAPLEYLRRVIAAPTHAGDEMRTITLLFTHAKFSDHAVEESMRTRAIEALGRIRAAIGGQA
jgi:hypothetical protein